MSYSFTVQASTKDEVNQMITAEFDAILESQSVHAADLPAARAAAAAFVDLLAAPAETEQVKVLVEGGLKLTGQAGVVSAGFGVRADLVPRDED